MVIHIIPSLSLWWVYFFSRSFTNSHPEAAQPNRSLTRGLNGLKMADHFRLPLQSCVDSCKNLSIMFKYWSTCPWLLFWRRPFNTYNHFCLVCVAMNNNVCLLLFCRHSYCKWITPDGVAKANRKWQWVKNSLSLISLKIKLWRVLLNEWVFFLLRWD